MGCLQGTIDLKNIYMITDAAELLTGSQEWSQGDREALQAWMGKYVEHLQSDHIKFERCSNNNHGTYFDVQYLTVLRCELLSIVLRLFPCSTIPVKGDSPRCKASLCASRR